MTPPALARAFDDLIDRIEDPNSMESWSEQRTAASLRQLRAKVLNTLAEFEVKLTQAQREESARKGRPIKPNQKEART